MKRGREKDKERQKAIILKKYYCRTNAYEKKKEKKIKTKTKNCF